MSRLLIGVKQNTLSRNGAKRKEAAQTQKALTKKIKAKHQDRCIYCGVKSETNEIHHIDGDHLNNNDENLAVICLLCHPYHHVGEVPRRDSEAVHREGHLPPKAVALTRFSTANAKAIAPEHLNHLLRIIGVALNDKEESAHAQAIYTRLVDAGQLAHFAAELYGDATVKTVNPRDIAAGMAQLTQDEFNRRNEHVSDIRVIYHPAYLKQLGAKLAEDLNGGLSKPVQWSTVLAKQIEQTKEQWLSNHKTEQTYSPAPAIDIDGDYEDVND